MGLGTFNVHPKGGDHIYFSKYKDHIWVKPCKTSVHNLIIGTMDIHHSGEMIGRNFTTGDELELLLPENGYFTKNPYDCKGSVKDKNGTVRISLSGDWRSHLDATIVATGEVVSLVKRKEVPANYEQQYRFTKFGININYLSKDDILVACPTDCRLRPDQRALEYGDEDLAESEKKRLEEKQRAKRKQMESQGTHWQPKWFVEETDQESGENIYKYNGGYWEAKSQGIWPNIDSLF
jgi:hypothetical protein